MGVGVRRLRGVGLVKPLLDLWVIYERPRDYPQGFVVRRWEVTPGEPERPDAVALYAPDLFAARCLVPPGKFNLHRQPEDDVAIREVWM